MAPCRWAPAFTFTAESEAHTQRLKWVRSAACSNDAAEYIVKAGVSRFLGIQETCYRQVRDEVMGALLSDVGLRIHQAFYWLPDVQPQPLTVATVSVTIHGDKEHFSHLTKV